MPRNFNEAGTGEMRIIDKSEKGGGVDIDQIERESKIESITNRIEQINAEKNQKGVGKGRKKQLGGELKKLTSDREELEAENVVHNENKKREDKSKIRSVDDLTIVTKEAEGKKLDSDLEKKKEAGEKAVNSGKKLLEPEKGEDTQKEAKIESPDISEPKKKRPAVRGSSEVPLEEGEIDATDEMMAKERARIAALQSAKESNQTPQEEKPEIIDTKPENENNSQKPMAVQQKFTGEYAGEIENRREMEKTGELSKFSEDFKQEKIGEFENYIKEQEVKEREDLVKRNEWQAEKIDKLKNLPEDEKEKMRETMMDDEMKRMSDEYPLDELRDKNQYQEKKIAELEKENTELKANKERVENQLAAMEAGIKEEKNKLIAEGEVERTTVEKVKNFIKKHPKATTVIALGLIGGGFAAFGSAPLYCGAQALVKAWGGSLWLPYAHGASSLTPAAATGAFFGGEKLAKWIGEKIGAVKTEKDAKTAVKEVLTRISSGAEAKSDEPQITEEKTEKAGGKQESFFSKIFGKRVGRDEKKPEGVLIKKTERMKKAAPETETSEEDKEKITEMLKEEAKKFNLFIEAFKNKKKDGKDVFEYLGKLARIYCKDSSKYCNIIDADISNQERRYGRNPYEVKISLIDSMIDYLKENNIKKEREWAKSLMTALFPWSGGGFEYSHAGKRENVEWLGWEYKGFEK